MNSTTDRPDGFGDERERELAEQLERAGAEQESVLAEAASVANAPGVGQVQGVLEAAREEAVAGRTPRRLRWIAVAAAAVLLVLVFVREPDETGDGPTGVHLSSGELEIVVPGEGERAWSAIEWRGPEQATFSVLVLSADGTDVLLERTALRTSRLVVEEADAAAWGDVVILVQAHDATGAVVDSVERAARHSP